MHRTTSNFRPSLPVADRANSRVAHQEIVRDRQHTVSSTQTIHNLGDRLRGELGATILQTLSRSSLHSAIAAVVRLGAKEKVIGIDTRGVVALMKDAQARRDRSESLLPRKTVGNGILTAVPHLNVSTPSHLVPARRGKAIAHVLNYTWISATCATDDRYRMEAH
jgi:hypothetical protein